MGINRNCLYPPPPLLLKLLLLLPPQNGETVQPLLSCIYDCLFPSGIYIGINLPPFLLVAKVLCLHCLDPPSRHIDSFDSKSPNSTHANRLT